MASVDVAILSCSLDRVFNTLKSQILKEFQSRYGVDNDLKKFKRKLSKIQVMLNDADQKQATNRLVEEWLVDVRELVYDAEDILDLYATQVGRWIQVCDSSHTSTKLSLNALKEKFDVESQLKEIIARSEDLVEQIDDLCLRADVVGKPTPKIIMRRERETTSLVDESGVYGRESDKKKLVELLLSDGHKGGNEVDVLPIVGMGGLGKTTLAQLVYNDEEVKKHFELKAWVCVSEETDVGRITKAILESLKGPCNYEFLESLQDSLKNSVNGKKFLIVLDDIWNVNQGIWDSLRKPFIFGEQGSRIIVTTRSEVISQMMGTISTYSLGGLANEDCRSLFWKCTAVGDECLSVRPNLKSIGDEIVGKCKGLPLAAKTLGSLLRFKGHENEWKEIAKTDIWDIPEGQNFILSILRLSYQHLPSYLKECFSYCSIFPKDYRFFEVELVLLWMAEGFLHSSEKKQMEDIGHSYFDDLLLRSFFQYCRDFFGRPLFVMHDLVHDLAQSISKETCIALDGDKLSIISEKARYSSLVNVNHQLVGLDAFYDAKHLRTLLRLPLDRSSSGGNDFIQKFAYNLFSTWRYLRVLSLKYLPIIELPDSFNYMRLLRYLDLSGTEISMLPKSVYDLYNLQTLILGENITKLSKEVHKLINLRHIQRDTDDTYNVFVVGKSDDSARLGDLKDLVHLTGELSIEELQNVVDVNDAKKANLDNRQHICKLTLEWSSSGRDTSSGEGKIVETEEIIECLQPHHDLKVLSIKSYPGTHFPSWIAILSGLVDLSLYHCQGIQVVPFLGLLKFPFLETLKFCNMPNWEEWSSKVEGIEKNERDDIFPRLAYLTIEGCPKLTGLPFNRLLSLIELKISKCEELITIPMLRILPIVGHDGKEFPCFRKLQIISCHKLRQLPHLFPSLENLRIKDCPELVALELPPSLKHLDISSMENVKHIGLSDFFGDKAVKGFPFLETLKFRNMLKWEEWSSRVEDLEENEHDELFPHLANLIIENCPKLTGLPFYRSPSLVELTISECNELTTIPRLGIPLVVGHDGEEFPCLRKLQIHSCHKLKQLPHLLPSLEHLNIKGCPQLIALPRLPVLRHADLNGCNSKTLFTRVGPVPSLSKLFISNIRRLKCLTQEFVQSLIALEDLCISACRNLLSMELHHSVSLQRLTIKKCPRLSSFLEMRLPPKLRRLEISEFESLVSLPKELCNLTCLEELIIDKCPSLISFTTIEDEEVGLFPASLEELNVKDCRNLKWLSRHEWINHNRTSLGDLTMDRCHITTALKKIRIYNCKNLEFLPAQMQNLTSLETLSIVRCPQLVTFPEGGLPTNLRLLEIGGCGDYLESLPKYVGLCKLTCLEILTINRCSGLLSFPKEEEEWQLPSTLLCLQVIHFKRLEFFQPKWMHNLTSLQYLHISKAPKLASLSEEKLPTTLQHLSIVKCPLLKESCQKENGRDWPNIAHIPNIYIT